MKRIEKTVFISYRRTNFPWALVIYQDLTNHGYDVFFDYTGIASGDFETAILGNIASRAHFLVLLTPSALRRCREPGDWFRREIEIAIETKRNVVPIMLEGFSFSTPSIGNQLTGKLSSLRQYQGLTLPPEYVTEGLERLRHKFLNVPLDAVVQPLPPGAERAARDEQIAALAAPEVTIDELTAQQWLELGLNASDVSEKLRCYTEAIALKPDFALTFYSRGNTRRAKGDLDGALADYSEAIHLNPQFADAFNNRGIARHDKGDLDGAIRDYDEAIRLQPDHALAFNNRGRAWRAKGDLDRAVSDYTEAIRFRPYPETFVNRSNAKRAKGDLSGAMADYKEALRLDPQLRRHVRSRG